MQEMGDYKVQQFQIFPKVGGYKVSGRFRVRPYNPPVVPLVKQFFGERDVFFIFIDSKINEPLR